MHAQRRYNDPQPSPARATYAPNTVTDNCKWIRRDSFAHSYCVAMGWTLLVEESDGMLFQAPADFNSTGVRAQAAH